MKNGAVLLGERRCTKQPENCSVLPHPSRDKYFRRLYARAFRSERDWQFVYQHRARLVASVGGGP